MRVIARTRKEMVMPSPIRTALVSPVPGNPVASGTALRNALAGIPSPSAADPWLLKIEPGIYDIGATSLQMRSWVDIEGSGVGVTTIRGNVSPGSDFQNGTVNGANDAELRLLTVEASGSSVVAMVNWKASPRLYRVKLVAQASSSVEGLRNVQSAPLLDECEINASVSTRRKGLSPSSEAYGIVFRAEVVGPRSSIVRSKVVVTGAAKNYGLHLVMAQTVTEIRDSRIDVAGGQKTYGIYAQGVSWGINENLALRNVEVSSAKGSSASYGVYFEPGSAISLDIFTSSLAGSDSPTTYGIAQYGPGAIVIQGSKIVGLTKTIDSPLGSVSVASTYLQGGPVTAGGGRHCMGVWDENGVFYASSCPP
jgi:hypothetical protein